MREMFEKCLCKLAILLHHYVRRKMSRYEETIKYLHEKQSIRRLHRVIFSYRYIIFFSSLFYTKTHTQ